MAETDEKTGGRKKGPKRLPKELRLWDVYCVASGAMFSSGLFLLPGIAAAQGGPSTVVAYLIAGLLMVPSTLSMAELATALPRAGGSYYFVDRSLGPAIGTVTGVGTWLALALKSAFALVGMGAYLAVMPGLAQHLTLGAAGATWFIKSVAVGFTVLFVIVNIVGAKQSTGLQNVLVVAILGVLGIFIVLGLVHVFGRMPPGELSERYTPFLHPENGLGGLVGTVGLVFVSYAGLTKVASISEEVRRPERNLPLGMFLSLATATAIYVAAVFLMIAVLDPAEMRDDLTPVATAAASLTSPLPDGVLFVAVIVAALAAFISTGNAGILSAGRYPFAMARDRLVPPRFERLGRFSTPTSAILVTGGAVVALIIVLTTEQVAKLGSSFNLLVFGLVNLAAIVMRESRIESYDPGFRIPLYPWTPLLGIAVSVWLIIEMGLLTTLFSLAVIAAGALWFWYYARPKVSRHGAIHHVFAWLGRYRHPGLQSEFREIIKEKGLRAEDPFDEVVRRAELYEVPAEASFEEVVSRAAEALSLRVALSSDEIEKRLLETGRYGGSPIAHGAVILHFRTSRVEHPQLFLARARQSLCVSLPTDEESPGEQPASCNVSGVFVLISPKEAVGQHLRALAQLAERVEDPLFMAAWRDMAQEGRLKESLLRDSRFLEVFVAGDLPSISLAGKEVRELDLPPGAFPAMVRRDGDAFEPSGQTKLEEEDRVVFIGEPPAIDRLYRRFVLGGEEE